MGRKVKEVVDMDVSEIYSLKSQLQNPGVTPLCYILNSLITSNRCRLVTVNSLQTEENRDSNIIYKIYKT